MTSSPSTKYTYDDFVLMPEDNRRREIIDGDLYVSPSPFTKHQAVCGSLLVLLQMQVRQHSAGHVYPALFDVIFSDVDIVEPDIIYVSKEREGIITEKNIQGAPDLLVEILSEWSRRTDEIIKRKLYERYGVTEYWIVDPEVETIKVYRLEGTAYGRVAELSNETGDMLTTPLLPHLGIPLSDVFTSR